MIRPALAAVVVAATMVACTQGEEAPESAAPPPVRVRLAPVRRGEITADLEVTGAVEALRVLRLASPVSGRVTLLTINAGDHVAAGEVAARVVPFEAEAALQGFAMLEGTSSALSADERRAIRSLRGRNGDVPLRAPFSGIVADRARNAGEQVAQGDVLLELFDPSSLHVLAQVPLAASRRIRPGMEVAIEGEGIRQMGKVVVLLAALTPPSLTVPVRVSLVPPPDRPVLHAPVRCRITTARHRRALLVPRPALLSSSSSRRGMVMVARGDVAVRTRVRTGLQTDREVEIHRGLAEGALVVVDGGYGLPDQTRIEPAQAAR